MYCTLFYVFDRHDRILLLTNFEEICPHRYAKFNAECQTPHTPFFSSRLTIDRPRQQILCADTLVPLMMDIRFALTTLISQRHNCAHISKIPRSRALSTRTILLTTTSLPQPPNLHTLAR